MSSKKNFSDDSNFWFEQEIAPWQQKIPSKNKAKKNDILMESLLESTQIDWRFIDRFATWAHYRVTAENEA